MKRKSVYYLLAISLVMALVFPSFVLAGWSGSQIVTVEPYDDWTGYLTIYTTVVDYAFNDFLASTFVLDIHALKGTDIDISATAYLPFRKMLYSTVGVRRGLYQSETRLTPYFSIAYRF